MFSDSSLSETVKGKVIEHPLDDDATDGDNTGWEDNFRKLGIRVAYSGQSVEVSMDICVSCRKLQE